MGRLEMCVLPFSLPSLPVSALMNGRNNTVAVKTVERNLQPLETLVAYDCRDFTFLNERLTGILESLSSFQQDGTLNYSRIRSELLRAPDAELTFFFHPPEPLDVTLGDIGYMDGNSFIKLYNVEHDIPFSPRRGAGVEYIASSSEYTSVEVVEDGTIQ